MSQPLRAQECEIGDRRLAAGQDDQRGLGGNSLAGPHHHEPDLRLELQRIEIVEIGDARQHRDGDRHARARGGRRALQRRGVFRRQARGGGKERDEAERPPARALLR